MLVSWPVVLALALKHHRQARYLAEDERDDFSAPRVRGSFGAFARLAAE